MDLTLLIAGNVVVLAAAIGAMAWFMARSRERHLRAARKAAAEHARHAEVAAMTQGLAHEIKNPLSTVGLNAQLLREEILDSSLADHDRERMVRRVDALARETGRLSDVLNDFLRYAGRLQLDPRPTDLRDVVRELADFFAPQAEQAQVALDLRLPDEPVNARVDPSLLKQVMLNLMLNAVQAMQRNPPGHPRRMVIELLPPPEGHSRRERIRGRAPDPPGAILRVLDTGPGIPEGMAERIFAPYVSARPGGNGLGLATARRIVEAHGGRIGVMAGTAGQPGGGGAFEIFLPVEGPPPVPAEAPATPASPSPSGAAVRTSP